jgi:hypothetical protein
VVTIPKEMLDEMNRLMLLGASSEPASKDGVVEFIEQPAAWIRSEGTLPQRKRVVFLAFDGVICTTSDYKRWRKRQNPQLAPHELMNRELVANVQELCERSGAVVVLSTSWRRQFPFEHIQFWLKEAGLLAEVVGATKCKMGHVGRATEITWFMAEHEPVLYSKDVVILEDAEPMLHLEGRTVRTTFEGPHPGFTKRHLKYALRLFGLEPK